jgi:predicted DNA binding protein
MLATPRKGRDPMLADLRLTPRQREVLALAIERGYYDYPRRITLSHLAKEAGVAKSTLSQTLMLIEREVMHRASQT